MKEKIKKFFRKPAMLRVRQLLAENITVRLPTDWSELSDYEAWLAFKLLANDAVSSEEVPFMLFALLNNLSVLGRSHSGDFVVAGNGGIFELSPYAAAEICRPLKFAMQPAGHPYRPTRFRRFFAVASDMQSLTFADWLCIENYLQRVISTSDFSLLDNLNPILMKRGKSLRDKLTHANSKFTRPERIAVFFWIQSVKDYLRRRFPHFYRGAESIQESAITPQDLQDAMDAQIRALTKGDITKENEVLEMNMYRALSELNALAREYKEMEAKINSK